MDWLRLTEKIADRIFILGLVALALYWASNNNAALKTKELETKVESIISNANTAFQQIQTEITALKAAKK